MTQARKPLLVLPSDQTDTAPVSTAIRELCTSLAIAPAAAYEIEVCVVEATNNALEHAYDRRPGGHVRVFATQDDGDLLIEVEDRGTAMEHEPPPEPPDADPLRERGRGWPIMRGWMDEVRYRSAEGRNTVLLRRRIDRPAGTPTG